VPCCCRRSTRSAERQLLERLDFDLPFRWFVDLGIDDPVWDHSTFSKNRDLLLAGNVATEFLATLLDQPKVRRLLSSERFSVDSRPIQARTSMKSFWPDAGGAPAAPAAATFTGSRSGRSRPTYRELRRRRNEA
jgi:hypothetical protein